jgi:hypothetical protein
MVEHFRRQSDIWMMSREEIINAVLGYNDGIRLRFVRSWLEQQSTQRLRVLLIAARVYAWPVATKET